MKTQINETKRMQLLAGLITENEIREGKMADRILVKVIAAIKDEYTKGNKNDTKSLMNAISEKTGYKVYDARAQSGPAAGMEGFTVGNYDVIVSLVDKNIYKSTLSKEESEYNKIGNWWIRVW
jgi:hypothetical protein